MKILIEEFKYQKKQALSLLRMIQPMEIDDRISIGYVGYYYSKQLNDCIFFLPKVVLNEDNLIFGKVSPEDIVDVENAFCKGVISRSEKDFIINFAVWIYKAIKEYNSNNPENSTIFRKTYSQIDTTQKRVYGTIIDVILSIIKFYKENHDFFIFTIKKKHASSGKIDWNKTITTHKAIFNTEGDVFYMNPIRKKNEIDFDEELIIIFYSILNYIKETYGFNIPIEFNYTLITGSRFALYQKAKGIKRLLEIRYKYYSDKTIILWTLCYSFFQQSQKITSSRQYEDYMMASNFYAVFEAIIDELIGDKNLPNGLKEQKDGKILDTLYKYDSLMSDSKIYYIADSKYYKAGHAVESSSHSAYKQYTYAKNVIQFNLDIFTADKQEQIPTSYRDDVTEGYNITPNFFISAEIDKDLRYSFEGLSHRESQIKRSSQFENRLFDRDTLWLLHYDINFLFVLAQYAKANTHHKEVFKAHARKKFRNSMREILANNYDFYSLTAKNGNLEETIQDTFRMLIGKAYRISTENDFIILALQSDCTGNDDILAALDQYFERENFFFCN
jgi:hypothetical protein